MIGTVVLGLLSIVIGGVSVVITLGSAYGDIERVRRGVEPIESFVELVDRASLVSGSTKEEYEEADDSSGPSPQLDVQGTQIESSVNLEAGFLPDPHEVALVGGGDVDASNLVDSQGDCVGYVDQTPDAQLEWSGATEELRIFFTAGDETEDATLLVWSETNEWFCNDDSSSLNPLVVLKRPAEGSYRIWVGSFEVGRPIFGRLSITELDFGPASWIEELAAGR